MHKQLSLNFADSETNINSDSLVSKYSVGLKILLLQGLSRPEFYGDLVHKFRKIIGINDFPYHFKMIIVRHENDWL